MDSVDQNKPIAIEEALEKARASLEKLIASQSSAPSRQQILAKQTELVSKARMAGISHARIAQSFSEHGIRMTKQDVAIYCRTALEEHHRKRKKRPQVSSKDIVASVVAEVSPQAKSVSMPQPAKAGSRPPASGLPQKSGADLPAPGRAGFRVARDEGL